MKKYLLVIFLSILLLTGCKDYTKPKEFLFQHPEIQLQMNGGEKFDKYTSTAFFKTLNKTNEILFIYIKDKKYEIFLDGKEHRIGDTKYFVSNNCF